MPSLRTPRPGSDRGAVLRRLERRIQRILDGGSRWPASSQASSQDRLAVPTGWPRADAAVGGLARGAVHEWLGPSEEREWSPPLAILVHLVWRAAAGGGARGGRVLWIGRRVWPYPRAMVRDFEVRERAELAAAPLTLELELDRAARSDGADLLLARSLLVDPSRPASRLWAIETALRCPSVGAVVADGSGLDMAATRRLQLAAEGGRSIGLIARPAREAGALSAAATRWRVGRPQPREDAAGPRWVLELSRCKGRSWAGSSR